MITCAHRNRVRRVSPASTGCEECSKLGERWVRLRMCLTCGHVGCCDSSRGRHATAHFEATGHPLMRSVEPGETWAWCYVDRQGFETAEVALEDPPAHEADQLESARPFVDALYRELLGRGIEYLFPEARDVSAFLDPTPYADAPSPVPDRVSDAIQVLRVSALTTYENRRIETGVLLFGATPEDCHAPPPRPPAALPYSTALTAIRSFH